MKIVNIIFIITSMMLIECEPTLDDATTILSTKTFKWN